MAKTQHINVHNLAFLTGLDAQALVQLARVLDGNIASLMTMSDERAERFREWRRRATFANVQPTDHNFSFRVYRWEGADGKITTIISTDSTPTTGGPGTPRRGAHVYCYMGASEGQEIVSVPLVYLLRERGPVAGHHVLYEHGAVDYSVTGEDAIKNLARGGPTVPMPKIGHGSNGLIYVGMTSRAWTTRYREHLYSAMKGSQLPFHRALRETFGSCNTRFHYVLMCFPTKSQAEDAEEHMVEQRSLFPKGLNAIPGGRAGLRYLASINALRPRQELSTEDLESKLAEYVTQNPEVLQAQPDLGRMWRDIPVGARPGAERPRPEMVHFWSDDANAARLITSREDRLTIEQIRNARYSAAMGLSASEIAQHIGARNVEVVSRLLAGKTYRRVM